MKESSKQDNIQNGFEEQLNKKPVLEPYADLKMIEDLKRAKRFDNHTKTEIINPRMGLIPPKPKKEESSKNNIEKRPAEKQVVQPKEVKNVVPPKQIVQPKIKTVPKATETNTSKPEPKLVPKPIQKQEQKIVTTQVPKTVVKPEPKPVIKPVAKPEPKPEPPKEPELVLIEEQVESAVEIPQMPARTKKPGVIDIKKIIGAPKSMKSINTEIKTIVAKGLADGIKIYLLEIGVYDVNRGYNASKLPHEITNFIKQTNNNRFNSTALAARFGVELDADHEDLEMVKFLSIKDLFDEIGENYPKSQIIRTTEDILDRDSNRFTLYEKKKMEELFEMNGIELPTDED